MAYKPNNDYNRKTREKATTSDWWEPQKGKKELIRVMPPWDERGICIVRRVLHYGFQEDERRRAFPCHADNEPWLPKQDCVVDHLILKLKSGDADERELAKELTTGSARFVINMVDCNNLSRGVQKWSAPLSFGKFFLDLLEDEDIENITDPKKGHDIYVEMSGKGRGTKYEYRLRPKATPIPIENWESKLSDLIKDIEVRSNRELADLLEESNGGAFDIKEMLSDFDFGDEKKKKKKGSPKEEDIDLDDMTIKQLKKLMKDENIFIGDDEWEGEDELRELLREELG